MTAFEPEANVSLRVLRSDGARAVPGLLRLTRP